MTVFNEPTKWQTSLVNSGDANVIPQSTPAGTGKASFKDGFPQITQIPLNAGGIAPDRKDFNGLFKVLGDSIFYMQNGGFWSYNSTFDYAVGRVVLYTDGNLYKCIQANTSVAPKAPTNTAYWTKIALSSDIRSFANTDLSNLSTAGQDILNRKANTDLSNLSTAGQDILDRKAYISLSNLNDTGNIIISRNAMPSLHYDDLTLGASGTSYTAPSNGYIYISKVATANNQYIYVFLTV